MWIALELERPRWKGEPLRRECLLPSATRLTAGADAGIGLPAGDALATERRRAIESAGRRALRTAGCDRAEWCMRRRALWAADRDRAQVTLERRMRRALRATLRADRGRRVRALRTDV